MKSLNTDLKNNRRVIRIHEGTKRIIPHTRVCTRSGETPIVSAMTPAAPVIT
jgi:hypothetical protein